MKSIVLFSMLLLSACSHPTYLVSNQLKVTSVTLVNDTMLVEVCGINNKGEMAYSWYKPSQPISVGDTLYIR